MPEDQEKPMLDYATPERRRTPASETIQLILRLVGIGLSLLVLALIVWMLVRY